MRRYLCLIILICFPIFAVGQKPFIDTNTFNTWITVKEPQISGDGKYVSYKIENSPQFSTTTVVSSTDRKWVKQFIGAYAAQFSKDSKRLLLKTPDVGLVIVRLGIDQTDTLKNVTKYRLLSNGKKEWFVYFDKNTLNIEDERGINKFSFQSVTDYEFSENGNMLAFVESKVNTENLKYLNIVDLDTRERRTIWDGLSISRITFNSSGSQLAFLMQNTKEPNYKSILYYEKGMEQAIELLNSDSLSLHKTLNISNSSNFYFSKDTESLLFNIESNNDAITGKKGTLVDVWSYSDPILQSVQLKNARRGDIIRCQLNVKTKQWNRLVFDDENVVSQPVFTDNGDIVLIQESNGSDNESYWNNRVYQRTFLLFTRTGQRFEINPGAKNFLRELHISPLGRYVVYYSASNRNYFSYDITTGITRNITERAGVSWSGFNSKDDINPYRYPVGTSGWLPGDKAILINSCYGLWKVDPSGKIPPINLTGNAEPDIIFHPAFKADGNLIADNEVLILKAFHTKTKDCGFYSVVPANPNTLRRLSMSNHTFERQGVNPNDYFASAVDFAKAEKGKGYLVSRQNTRTSLNFFYTRDFITFTPVSNIHPESNVNWMTAELHTFSIKTGLESAGVLYKPENFNLERKYPVIIYYYEEMTSNLNRFWPAEPSGGMGIPISYFVSNGYLVFTPDIQFKECKGGQCALQTVEAAARYLGSQSFVNANKLGICGHSFGGYETNYIVTHSAMFAAAASGAGMSNLTSGSGALFERSGISKQSEIENGNYRMGTTLWNDTEGYIENSPVFAADKVNTPILLFHNSQDQSVPFAQGVEFFIALRRLGKVAWLLQYDGQNHRNWDEAAIDVTIRQTQFFDHYLKDAPITKWMGIGIPAKAKGIESGLEYLGGQ